MTVLDPTPGAAAEPARMAPGLDSLTGRTVGLLDNGKFNVIHFLDHVEDILTASYGVAVVLRRRKTNQNAPVPPAMLGELLECDAVVSAVGD